MICFPLVIFPVFCYILIVSGWPDGNCTLSGFGHDAVGAPVSSAWLGRVWGDAAFFAESIAGATERSSPGGGLCGCLKAAQFFSSEFPYYAEALFFLLFYTVCDILPVEESVAGLLSLPGDGSRALTVPVSSIIMGTVF